MRARYVFAVRFRIEPVAPGVTVDPAEFETRVFRRADEPGTDGWLFFRDNLWRGRLGDGAYFEELTAEALDVPVVDVSYRAFESDREYLTALEETIADRLDRFNADSVEEVLSKYLGSSLEVREDW